ncbi:MAG: LLM class flavin-dependent oxidoreductase [Gammaproteobacteria bacterium]|nr:LLM class flavin-dependent oxidoreductase [Gammaproteobacteria bacterium]MCP4090518.1 LLM class flavin-dependent oxidoreductase [Gammaproteobacteria bacterium]MCP4276617.1 LLM class flavin-dependent oxidoreductase [Gammaproteobacteria bacterium]MCP4831367.1 LLM class flavin-dependent oxidoreductase [Gammaproteobacteria bacterium]MCP4927911.1 LLM class flavin-dependent oxidoreductase [Gammaproteobacteria bacterium]
MYLDIALESKVGPNQFKELGLLAEQYGFRAIWAQNYARGPDAFMTAVPLALASKSINIGVAVVCPHEMHPLKIANSVLTLNEYAQGRANVVVTSGGEWPGIIKKKSGEITRTREALEIINASMGDAVVNYSGEKYNVQAFSTAWTKQLPPKIYAGAHRPKMMRMATEQTNAIMLSDIQPPMFDWALTELKQILTHKKPEDNFHLSNFVSWHVKEKGDVSLWEARRELIIRGWLAHDWIAPYLSPEDTEWVTANTWPFLKAFRERTGDIKGVPAHIIDALIEGLTLSGDLNDIDRHIKRLQEFKAAGFSEIVLGLQDNPADSIKMIGEHVLPKLIN